MFNCMSKFYLLPHTVLSVKNNAQAFLNGLASNSLDQPRNAFLNLHGRVIATFDQVKAGDDEHLLVFPKAYTDAVLNHLGRYARLNKTILTCQERAVCFDCDGSHKVMPEEFAIAQHAGQIVITPKAHTATVTEEEFTEFRLNHRIPLMGVDYQADEMILNIDPVEYVSYTKGCFLGQEPVAKVYHRSKPSWKLTVSDDEATIHNARGAMTSVVVKGNKRRGFVFVKNDQ